MTQPGAVANPSPLDEWRAEVGDEAVAAAVEEARRKIASGQVAELVRREEAPRESA